MPHYTDQQLRDQDRSAERVQAYNQLERQKGNFAPAPDNHSPIAFASPSLENSQPSFFSSTDNRPKNRLSSKEKSDLKREKRRIKDFGETEARKNTPVVQFAL